MKDRVWIDGVFLPYSSNPNDDRKSLLILNVFPFFRASLAHQTRQLFFGFWRHKMYGTRAIRAIRKNPFQPIIAYECQFVHLTWAFFQVIHEHINVGPCQGLTFVHALLRPSWWRENSSQAQPARQNF